MFDLETIKAMNQPGFKAHKTEPIIGPSGGKVDKG